MLSLILSAAALALGIGTSITTEFQAHSGNTIKGHIEKLAKAIYSKINKNSKLLEKLQQAYSDRNTGLINAIFSQAGFGPAVQALNAEVAKAKAEYEKEKDKVSDENTKLTNNYNQLVNAEQQTGSVAGNKYARQTFNQVSQAVKGGLDDYEHYSLDANAFKPV